MTYETLLVEHSNDVAEVTLNRPEKMNALNATMLGELAEIIGSGLGDARCLLLLGAGRAFSAGADLTDGLVGAGGDAGEALDRHYHPVIRGLDALDIPIVAAVEGVAAGAGCNLALAADIVIAGRSARFDQAFVRIGLISDCGGTHRLPRLVGEARARGLMMLGEAIDGSAAADWGLIWKAVSDGEAAGEARAIAERLANGPTGAIGLAKQALRAGATTDLDTQLETERRLQSKAAASADFSEGIAAFREKRNPVFSGK